MSRPHPKVLIPITEGVDRPRHVSPKPDHDHWLEASQLEAAYAWRIATATVTDLERLPAFAHDTPMNTDWEPWQRFKELIHDGDDLWVFSSPVKFWQAGMGVRGVILVRDESPVAIVNCAFN